MSTRIDPRSGYTLSQHPSFIAAFGTHMALDREVVQQRYEMAREREAYTLRSRFGDRLGARGERQE